MSPYENILLSTLSTLTDETHNIVREILQKKHPDNYLNKAEDLGFIKSSLEFQDLLNIRHLLHHQFETLDGYGRFINGENNQNKSIRTRYMESYQRLCEGTFYERVARYIKTANGFKPLVETLVPNIFIRAKEESNNKFIQRVKEYASTHKNQTIYIDTTYPFKEKKKEALIKALKKLVPNVEIIDNIEEGNIDAFSVRIDNYLDRCKYLELFQVIEHRIGEYCLFEGDKCPPHQGWARLANKRILTPQEAEKWNQYKTLRNDLSHKYLSDDLLEKLRETLPLLVEETINLSSRLDELKPEVTVGENNIFTITHKDGRIIEVDFENKEILSINDNNGNKLKTKRVSIPRGRFTEEYPNGTKISLKGAEIQAITLPNGSTIDVQKGRLYVSDDTKFFIDNDKCYLVTPNAKLILDTDFKLISYIEKQRRINVGNNEIIKPSPNHTIIIDEKGYFKSIEYGNGKKYAHVTLKKQKNGFLASFSDGTKWSKTDTDSIITHNNIELTYENRKKFIESYDDGKDPHIRSINLPYNR